MENQCRAEETPRPLQLGSFFVSVLFLVMTVLFSACGSQNTGSTGTTGSPTVAPSPTSGHKTDQITPTATVNGGYPVKVYFSKTNATNFDDVGAVDRVSPTASVGTFAVEEVVAGPTQDEKNQGLSSQLHDSINGPSNCSGQNAIGGSDFLLTVNKKGTVDEQGTATLQFCRDISSAGIGSDARIKAEVTTTLKQFSTIQKVVILSKSGSCFGDESGLNMCLK
jgi:Sporulation and spore germination